MQKQRSTFLNMLILEIQGKKTLATNSKHICICKGCFMLYMKVWYKSIKNDTLSACLLYIFLNHFCIHSYSLSGLITQFLIRIVSVFPISAGRVNVMVVPCLSPYRVGSYFYPPTRITIQTACFHAL